ncbi:MAG: DUF305 domain-containing protein [Gemmatimonadaceae bacterium]
MPLRQLSPIGGRASLVLAAAALFAALPSAARAQDSMPAMPGMSGQHAITIPPGAEYTVADVEFMQGMIAHHAQAIYMSQIAAAHHASARLLRLATKIDQSQVSEIAIMQNWLRQNGQFAPDTSSWHTMHMAGMLSDAQIRALDAVTGEAFDRAYLAGMIQHHEGALTMVKDLFAVPRAGQEVNVNVFANDVVTVQTAEIGIMEQMQSQLADK